MTGFEFLLTPLPINKIRHLAMQKSEKRGRIYATLQPDATRKILLPLSGHNDPPALFGRRPPRMESSSCTATHTPRCGENIDEVRRCRNEGGFWM